MASADPLDQIPRTVTSGLGSHSCSAVGRCRGTARTLVLRGANESTRRPRGDRHWPRLADWPQTLSPARDSEAGTVPRPSIPAERLPLPYLRGTGHPRGTSPRRASPRPAIPAERGMPRLLPHPLPAQRQWTAVGVPGGAVACRGYGTVGAKPPARYGAGSSGPIPPQPVVQAPAPSTGSAQKTRRPVVGWATVAAHWPPRPRWRLLCLFPVRFSPVAVSLVPVPRTQMSGASSCSKQWHWDQTPPLSVSCGPVSSPGESGGPWTPERGKRLVPFGGVPSPVAGAQALLSGVPAVVVAGLPIGSPAASCTTAGRRDPARPEAETTGPVGDAVPCRRAATASSQMFLVRPSA